ASQAGDSVFLLSSFTKFEFHFGFRHGAQIRYPMPSGDNVANTPGSDGAATFANSESLAFFHCDRSDNLYFNRHVITWHNHFHALRQSHRSGHVGGPKVELGAIIGEEGRVASTFILG